MYIAGPVTHDAAAAACPTPNTLWCPNLEDLDLYRKIAQANHGQFFSKTHFLLFYNHFEKLFDEE